MAKRGGQYGFTAFGDSTIDAASIPLHSNAFRHFDSSGNPIDPTTVAGNRIKNCPPDQSSTCVANGINNYWILGRVDASSPLTIDLQDPYKVVPPATFEWPLSAIAGSLIPAMTRLPGYYPISQSSTALTLLDPYFYLAPSGALTKSITLKASLIAADSTYCDVNGKTVTFNVNEGLIIQDATVSGGVASLQLTLPTNQVYEVKATFAGSAYCAASSADKTDYTIATMDGAAMGGGWYKATSMPATRAHFGFVAMIDKQTKLPNGRLIWIHDKHNRLRSTSITAVTNGLPCPDKINFNKCGLIQGAAQLQSWTLTGSGGYWGPGSDVTFTATVYDGGVKTVCKNKVCKTTDRVDFFGMSVDGVTLPGETAPVALSGGSIIVK